MSQAEVLRCLYNLGGSGTMQQLTDEYNRIHFPRNQNYRQLNIIEVKKTMQTDTAKLLRDKLIAREYRKPTRRDPYKQFRRFAFYSITDFGHNYIKLYNICKPIEITK